MYAVKNVKTSRNSTTVYARIAQSCKIQEAKTELKEELNKSIIITQDVNTPFSIVG